VTRTTTVPAAKLPEMDAQEHATRVDLAACYRLIDRYGMSDMVYNHITARIPGQENEYLINAYGYRYDEITASNLYKIDIDGNVLARPDTHYGITPAGYIIHSAVHSARPDAGCVIHTHARASMAVSMLECGFLPLSQHAMRFYGNVSYHDYEGPAADLAEREKLIANLGDNQVMFLRNHGLLVVAPSIPEAFNMIYWVEMACKAQLDAMATGANLVVPPEEARVLTADLLQPKEPGKKLSLDLYDEEVRRPYGVMEWEAMLRLLDRDSPDFRD
jgi:ribulose-5-phosphate 4-epimerase/fuculose-1-phosphate aldolase